MRDYPKQNMFIFYRPSTDSSGTNNKIEIFLKTLGLRIG